MSWWAPPTCWQVAVHHWYLFIKMNHNLPDPITLRHFAVHWKSMVVCFNSLSHHECSLPSFSAIQQHLVRTLQVVKSFAEAECLCHEQPRSWSLEKAFESQYSRQEARMGSRWILSKKSSEFAGFRMYTSMALFHFTISRDFDLHPPISL